MFPGKTPGKVRKCQDEVETLTHFVEDSVVEAIEILVDFFLQDVVEVLHLPKCQDHFTS